MEVRVATRTLDRLPARTWHDQLAPLDVPMHAVLRGPLVCPVGEQQQQQ
jgi:hypothetical protein